MAVKDGKTEKATAKRKSDERKKGNIPQSKDVVTVISLVGMAAVLKARLTPMYDAISQYFAKYINYMATLENLSEDTIKFLLLDFIKNFVSITLLLILCSVFFAIVATVAQTKPVFVWDALKPKFSKLNPIKGIQNLFSLRNTVEILKGIAKISVLIAIIYNFFKGRVGAFVRTMDIPLSSSVSYLIDSTFSLVWTVSLAFAAIAIVDILYVKWDSDTNMMMSKQEVKDEYKNIEGDPQIKGKIKQKQREMAMSRMMQAVPEADVIIKNPTHFAVALKYDIDKDDAPRLIAKGQDEMALRIIAAGEKAGVYIVENVPLARAIYATTDLGKTIPQDFYGVIAEILVQVYKLNDKLPQ